MTAGGRVGGMIKMALIRGQVVVPRVQVPVPALRRGDVESGRVRGSSGGLEGVTGAIPN